MCASGSQASMRCTERSYCESCGYKSIIIIIILDTTNIADYIHLKNIYSNDRFPTHIDEEHSHSIPFGRFSAPIAIPWWIVCASMCLRECVFVRCMFLSFLVTFNPFLWDIFRITIYIHTM